MDERACQFKPIELLNHCEKGGGIDFGFGDIQKLKFDRDGGSTSTKYKYTHTHKLRLQRSKPIAFHFSFVCSLRRTNALTCSREVSINAAGSHLLASKR